MKESTNQQDFTSNKLANIYFEHAGAMMLLLDKDGYVVNINKKGCEVLKCKNKQEIKDKNWIENFIPEGLRTKTTQVLKTIFQEGIDAYRNTEHEILNCQGEILLVRWHNELLEEYGLILSSGEDITANKEKEKVRRFKWDSK